MDLFAIAEFRQDMPSARPPIQIAPIRNIGKENTDRAVARRRRNGCRTGLTRYFWLNANGCTSMKHVMLLPAFLEPWLEAIGCFQYPDISLDGRQYLAEAVEPVWIEVSPLIRSAEIPAFEFTHAGWCSQSVVFVADCLECSFYYGYDLTIWGVWQCPH